MIIQMTLIFYHVETVYFTSIDGVCARNAKIALINYLFTHLSYQS